MKDFLKIPDKFNIHTLCGLTREAIDNILYQIMRHKFHLTLMKF